jgi:hypothetical protein
LCSLIPVQEQVMNELDTPNASLNTNFAKWLDIKMSKSLSHDHTYCVLN